MSFAHGMWYVIKEGYARERQGSWVARDAPCAHEQPSEALAPPTAAAARAQAQRVPRRRTGQPCRSRAGLARHTARRVRALARTHRSKSAFALREPRHSALKARFGDRYFDTGGLAG